MYWRPGRRRRRATALQDALCELLLFLTPFGILEQNDVVGFDEALEGALVPGQVLSQVTGLGFTDNVGSDGDMLQRGFCAFIGHYGEDSETTVMTECEKTVYRHESQKRLRCR